MRDLSSVEVSEAIVHILEPKSGNVVFSERSIPMASNPVLSQYFAKHIKLSIQDQAAKAARFPERNPEKPSGICHNMFKGGPHFVTGSQLLSEQLCEVMEADDRIADGNLVVCLYKDVTEPADKYMALIKLDPVGAFRNVEITDKKTGKKYVDLQIDPFVFPRDTNILQKGAYIGRTADRKDYQILFVDKQLKRGEIAKFFYQDFLGAAFVWDSAELTRLLYKCLIEALNNLRPSLTANEDRYLGAKIYQIFTQSGKFDIYPWLNALNASAHIKTELRQNLQKWLPGVQEIERELWLARILAGRRTFFGEGQSRFSILSNSYDNVVQSVERKNVPGRRPFYEVVIHTSSWREEA